MPLLVQGSSSKAVNSTILAGWPGGIGGLVGDAAGGVATWKLLTSEAVKQTVQNNGTIAAVTSLTTAEILKINAGTVVGSLVLGMAGATAASLYKAATRPSEPQLQPHSYEMV